MLRVTMITLTMGAALAMAGCANDSLLGGAPEPTAALPAKPAVDPACSSLAARIDALRKDGVVERVEQAAAKGKSATVSVKRASLSQMAELEKANAEFQAKCSTLPRTAAVATPVAAPAPAPVQQAKAAAPKAAAEQAKQ